MNLKIVIIGIGSEIFGRGMLADTISSTELQKLNTTLYLVDINKSALQRMFKLANLFKNYFKSNIKIKATTDRIEALKGAKYVITSVARKRYKLWEQDFRIPLSYGFKHCLGENGGPGAIFHALRSFELMIPIAKDIEKIAPDAYLLNFTNPESRVVMAVKSLTNVKVYGLCHGPFSCRHKTASLLNRDESSLDMVTGGLNHFFFLLKVKDKKTGKDLYPELRKAILKNDSNVPPLVKKMVEIFGYFTYPSDDHIGEYLSFAHNFTGIKWHYGQECKKVTIEESPKIDLIGEYLNGKREIDEKITSRTEELAVPIICDIEFNKGKWEPAINTTNDELYIENLPQDAVVEVPFVADKNGIQPQKVGTLPEALASFCRTQISIQKLLVEAYRKKSKKLLLQALLLDPIVNNIANAEKMLNDMLEIQSDFLPKFK